MSHIFYIVLIVLNNILAQACKRKYQATAIMKQPNLMVIIRVILLNTKQGYPNKLPKLKFKMASYTARNHRNMAIAYPLLGFSLLNSAVSPT